MAIMWDAQKPAVVAESASRLAWRLRFAQMLVASGWDAAVVREALVPDQNRLTHEEPAEEPFPTSKVA